MFAISASTARTKLYGFNTVSKFEDIRVGEDEKNGFLEFYKASSAS